MRILNITIQEKGSSLDNSWLDGKAPSPMGNFKKLPGNSFSIVFNDKNYYLFSNERFDILKENYSVSLKDYRINFSHEEEASVRKIASFANSLHDDAFHSQKTFFSPPKEERDADERLNFLYSGLSSIHRENFLIPESPTLPYPSFQKDRNSTEENSTLPKKNERLFHLPSQMIQNTLRILKKEKA